MRLGHRMTPGERLTWFGFKWPGVCLRNPAVRFGCCIAFPIIRTVARNGEPESSADMVIVWRMAHSIYDGLRCGKNQYYPSLSIHTVKYTGHINIKNTHNLSIYSSVKKLIRFHMTYRVDPTKKPTGQCDPPRGAAPCPAFDSRCFRPRPRIPAQRRTQAKYP